MIQVWWKRLLIVKWYFWLLACIVIIIILVVIRNNNANSIKFSWTSVSRGDIQEYVTANGEIQAKARVNVGTLMIAEIAAIHVKEGQEIEAGQLLVSLDREKLLRELEGRRAALTAAIAEKDRLEGVQLRSEETLQRMEALYSRGLLAEEDFRQQRLARNNATYLAAASRAQVAQTEASLRSLQNDLSKTELRAPISGRITSLRAEKGEMAIPGQSNLPGATLMVISDMSQLVAELKVNESEVRYIKPGQPAQIIVESFSERVFKGTVGEVVNSGEKQGQGGNQYKVKILLDMTLDDVNSLRPAMGVRATILTRQAVGILRAPLDSVIEKESTREEANRRGHFLPIKRTVVMLYADGKVKEVEVQTGISDFQVIEIKSNLQIGEIILTGPPRLLRDLREGDRISLKAKPDSTFGKEHQLREER